MYQHVTCHVSRGTRHALVPVAPRDPGEGGGEGVGCEPLRAAQDVELPDDAEVHPPALGRYCRYIIYTSGYCIDIHGYILFS